MTKAQTYLAFQKALDTNCTKATPDHAARLVSISRSLHRLDIEHCERDLTPGEETRQSKLKAEVKAICKEIGGITEIQWPDPRAGVGIRLIFTDRQFTNSFGGEGWNVPV